VAELDARRRQPWVLRLASGRVFAFAGLWEPPAAAGLAPTCAILTTEPNALARPIHDRMPAILDPADYARWLDPAAAAPGDVRPLLRPFPAEAMAAWPVGPAVNDPRVDDPRCLAPAPGAQAPPRVLSGT
jgi:putative SOS response-associated peptidase YedK